jgi:hypothetical protein
MDSDISYNYLVIDKYKNKRGEDMTELKEHEDKLIIKQYSGINSDNFIIKKYDGKKISFSFFKLNGIYYININGEHIIDYKKFVNIQQISNIDQEDDKISSIKVKNAYIGDIMIHNCDPEIFQKALSVMSNYMKNKSNYVSDLMHFVFS